MSENPYLPPRSQVVARPSLPRHPGQGSPFGCYREPGWLAKGLVFFLTISIALSVLSIYRSWADLQTAAFSRSDYETSSRRLEELIDLGFMVVIFPLAVLWCIWTSRVCRNAWVINSRDGATAIYRGRKSYSPLESVVFYFVPVMNLYVPFLAMAWIRDASQKPLGLTMGKLVGLWWVFWILSLFGGIFLGYLHSEANLVEDMLRVERLAIVLSPLDILSAIVGILMVSRLSSIQKKRAHDLGLT